MKADEDIAGLYRYFNKFDFLKDQRDQQSDKDKKNKLKAGNAQRQQNKKAQEMAKDQKSIE